MARLRGAAMTATIDELLAAHFRYERANTATRRFISRSVDAVLPRSAVVGFLRNRRDPISSDDIERCADEAIERWLRSPANRYRAARQQGSR
jgi:hypothetical protein